MEQLLQKAAQALRDAARYGAGDWSELVDALERRASPASAPEGQALWDSVYKTLRGYRMTMMVDSDGDGYPLIDAMSPEHGTVKSGIDECTYLADAIYNDLLAAAPTPPVSEDRWLPIKTAPKDGTTVLLKCPHMNAIVSGHYGEVTDGDWETGYSCWMEWLIDDELWIQEDPSQAPTHWMPLPKAPAMQEDKP